MPRPEKCPLMLGPNVIQLTSATTISGASGTLTAVNRRALSVPTICTIFTCNTRKEKDHERVRVFVPWGRAADIARAKSAGPAEVAGLVQGPRRQGACS